MIAVLFVRGDSAYKNYNDLDVYDAERDALTFTGDMPVIAHPPCRAWGRLSHMANPREGERELALFALANVRALGGVLEHPKGSKLWKEQSLPTGNDTDGYGGLRLR